MIINVPKEDIEAILEMADSVVGHYLSLPQNEGWFQMPRFAVRIHQLLPKVLKSNHNSIVALNLRYEKN